MTIREDEISAMGNPFAWLRRARGAPLRYSVHHCTCLAQKRRARCGVTCLQHERKGEGRTGKSRLARVRLVLG